MAIAVQLDEIMADRRVSLNELSEKVGVTNVNLSRIKTGKVRSMRFSTLEKICESLEPAGRHIEVRGAISAENELTVKGIFAKMPD